MSTITDSTELKAFCLGLKDKPFITVDTEFLRDKTYYPRLCLMQIAAPGVDAVAVDPLAEEIDLQPVFDLLSDENIVKVFHAARQDLEIFYNLTGTIPHPLFDTQVAAMVCGYGDQIGYHNLVQGICNARLDKGAQFTDWSRRPLSKKQLSYALDDVTYLRDIYLSLQSELERRNRTRWVREEMEVLCDPATYTNQPEEAWRRIKIRSDKPQVLSILKALGAWREREAQRRDVPRNRVIRDETLVDIAVHAPTTPKELARSRNVTEDMANGRLGSALIEAVKEGLAVPDKERPRLPRKEGFPNDLKPALEMLKMLLRIQCAENDVAAKILASSSDLEKLALDDNADIPALKGWRREVFGEAALALKHGQITLGLKGKDIQVRRTG